MTRQEMTEIFSALMLAYPSAEMFRGGVGKLGPTIMLWADCLGEVDFWTAQKAVVRLCRSCRFPPTIAEMREACEAVEAQVRGEIDEAWAQVRRSCIGKSVAEGIASLPPRSRARAVVEAMGGPEALTQAGEHGTEWLDYAGFVGVYRAKLRERAVLVPGANPRALEG